MPRGGLSPTSMVALSFLVVTAVLGGLLMVHTYSAAHSNCTVYSGPVPSNIPSGGLHYDSTTVTIPAAGGGWGPLTNVSFEGVGFWFYPQAYSAGIAMIEAEGVEANAIALSFVLLSNLTGGVALQWSAPDGVFSVNWTGAGPLTAVLRLSVADPAPVYALLPVELPTSLTNPANSSCSTFLGVRFTFSTLGYGGPAGDALNARVTVPNGTAYLLGVWQGTELACSVNLPAPAPDNWTCLESVSTDHAVGFTSDYGWGVTLMVRTS